MRSELLTWIGLGCALAAACGLGGCMSVAPMGQMVPSEAPMARWAEDSAVGAPVDPDADVPDEADAPAETPPREIVYTADLAVAVEDVERAMFDSRDLAGSLGGYCQRMSGSRVVLRVPADRFDEAVDRIEQMGAMLRRDIEAVDVTERNIDLEVRLRNKRAMLRRLERLVQEAATVEEALKVEAEMARVRTEIERLEGRLLATRNRVRYATVTVDFRALQSAGPAVRSELPFAWLRRLGLATLLTF